MVENIDQKKIDLAIAQIEKQYGDNAVMQFGSANIKPWPSVPTGALTLDIALGIGGLPKGRVVEIYGPESSGKSTVALSVVGEAQRNGDRCLFIDAEHSLDPGYAQKIGVNMDELLISQPDYGEQAIDIMTNMCKTGAIQVVVVDSVAALTPKAEIEGTAEDAHMGLQARLMAKAMRRIVSVANEHNILIIFINQLREKIGVMFGNPEVTPGGRALKFAASVRLDLRKIESLKDPDGNFFGIKVKAKVTKNKMAPPFKIAELDILYARGVDKLGCILDLAAQEDVVKKAGAWYSYDGENFGHGRNKAIEFLSQDLDFAEEIKHKALVSLGLEEEEEEEVLVEKNIEQGENEND